MYSWVRIPPLALMKMKSTEKVLSKIEEQAKQVFLPLVGRKKGKLLEAIVRKKQPKLILEIGTLIGFSAILMAQHLKGGKIISIEIAPHAAAAAERNLKDAGFSEKVKVLVGDALSIIPKLKDKFGLVFVDAAKEEYLSYLQMLEKRNLQKGTVVVADNAKIFADAMQDYLHYVRNSGRYKSKFYDFGEDGMEVSVRL